MLFFIAGSDEKVLKGVEVLSLHLPLEAETAVDDLSSMSISIDESLMLLVSTTSTSPCKDLNN